MTSARQWSIQRARWAALSGFFICMVGLLGVDYLLLFFLLQGPPTYFWMLSLFLPAACVAILWLRHTDPGPGTLTLLDTGLWEVRQKDFVGNARLTHAWPAFAWITLRFDFTESTRDERPVELTVWRSGVSAPAWRYLCVYVARQSVLPGRALNKEVP